MRDVLQTLESWTAEGRRVAVATVVERQGSAPRDPGASLAVNERGELAGSVTGGCVEPAVIREANEVLAGGPARICRYGIADADAFEVGLSCGGTVAIAVFALDPAVVAPLAGAIADDRPAALTVRLDGEAAGRQRVVSADSTDPEDAPALELLALGESGTVAAPDGGLLFVESYAPRPAMYVFGAVDHAAALVTVGRFLGYRVTVCDARRAFVTPERFPDADALVVEWPDRFLETAPVDARTAICVLTHDQKFDLPVLQAALRTPARYIGAMGSRKTTEERAQRLREAGVPDAELARIHAPIGIPIGARSPEEVAVAVAAQLIEAASRSRTHAPAPLTV
ncbi:MAG: XdhC family protein [Gaiellaceae bacterium]